jgi:hypothetical protein
MKAFGNIDKDAIIRAAVSEGFTVSNSVGSGVVFETANTQGIAATYDTSNDKVVIVFRDSGANGQAVVGTVSGTSISFGTPVQFESGDVNNNSVVFDSSNNKVIISYVDTGNSDYGTSVVGTVSGTSISFGTPVVFNSGGTSNVSSAFDTSANKVVIAYRESSGKAIVGTLEAKLNLKLEARIVLQQRMMLTQIKQLLPIEITVIQIKEKQLLALFLVQV